MRPRARRVGSAAMAFTFVQPESARVNRPQVPAAERFGRRPGRTAAPVRAGRRVSAMRSEEGSAMVTAAAGPAAIVAPFPVADGDVPEPVRHGPGGRHRLDPGRPELFRERLEELRALQQRAGGHPDSGCVQMLDLEQVRLRFGRRWPALRDKALQFVVAALERALGDQDRYLLADGDRIHLLCSGLPHEDVRRRAQLLAGAITERLCGINPGGAGVRVRSAPVDLRQQKARLRPPVQFPHLPLRARPPEN